MAWLRYNDMVEPSDASPRMVGLLFVLSVVGSLGASAYALWRDWQHHRLDGMHLLGLLASLSLTSLIVGAARRAWRSRGSRGTSKAA